MAFAGSAIVASLAAVAVPAGAAEWVQKKVGAYWSAWVPNDGWLVSGFRAGIDVTSPAGDEGVSRGWTTWMSPLTPSQVADYFMRTAYSTGDFSNGRIVESGAAAPSANGQRQIFTWTAAHRSASGNQTVRGSMYVETNDNPAQGYGFTFWVLYAPVAKYDADFATLDSILGRIVVYASVQ